MIRECDLAECGTLHNAVTPIDLQSTNVVGAFEGVLLMDSKIIHNLVAFATWCVDLGGRSYQSLRSISSG